MIESYWMLLLHRMRYIDDLCYLRYLTLWLYDFLVPVRLNPLLFMISTIELSNYLCAVKECAYPSFSIILCNLNIHYVLYNSLASISIFLIYSRSLFKLLRIEENFSMSSTFIYSIYNWNFINSNIEKVNDSEQFIFLILRWVAIHFKDKEETKEPSSMTSSHYLVKIKDLHRGFQNINKKCKCSDN